MSEAFCRETLQEHNVTQLRNWAHTLNIKTRGYVKKQDLIQKIIETISVPRQKRPRTITVDPLAPSFKKRRVAPKPQLSQVAAAQRIQKFFRRYVRGFVNREDFMTLDPFGSGPIFRHVVDVNQIYRFYPLPLWRYFQESGLLRNPYTQSDFNNIEVKRLQKMLRKVDPTFSVDILASRDELRRNALDAINLEHNILFYYEHLHDTVIGMLQQAMNDGTAFDMTTSDLFVNVELWSMQEGIVNTYLYTLLQLSRSRAMAFVYDMINARVITGMNLGYTLQFRLFANLVTTTVENLFLYFSALAPHEQPFLFAHNIWNTVIQQTLMHHGLIGGPLPLGQVPALQQNNPVPALQPHAIVLPEEGDETDETDETDDEEEQDIVEPPPPDPRPRSI
jgi:hypothetical protein